jgi:hypothetical protein
MINEALWRQLSQVVMTGMREWRLQHPKAPLREMAQELDTRLNWMRARMLEDMALVSATTDWETDRKVTTSLEACLECPPSARSRRFPSHPSRMFARSIRPLAALVR